MPKSTWNKGKLVGQKLALKLEEIWAIRIRLQLSNNLRGLAMFNLALDSKLRACDLIKLKVRDIAHGSAIQSRAILIQQKTQKPVQFEITQKTRASLVEWINFKKLQNTDFLFESRVKKNCPLTTWQYTRITKSSLTGGVVLG